MYECSAAFHTAVANDNEQKALLIFSDCVFTDADIVIDRGIELDDNFNMEEDLSIGQATSNEIRFSLVNENRLLNNYGFGEFLATIGVYTGSNNYTKETNETFRINTGSNTYVAYSTYPYLKRNGAAISTQPAGVAKSMLAYNGKVYCFCESSYIVYDDGTGANITSSNQVNSFMLNKATSWAGKGIFYNKSTRILKIWQNGVIDNYEFCPLGWFTAERPKAPDVIQIDLTCYDFMQKFEKDMSEVSITFPITIQGLFVRLCEVAGVSYVLPSLFINGDAVITSKPADFDNVNMREVLKWIAEASGNNARFDRDGKLRLEWLRTGTGQSYGASGYSEFNPYWYETKTVTKLYNRDTQSGTEVTGGESNGDEAYLIQDNPLLRGATWNG